MIVVVLQESLYLERCVLVNSLYIQDHKLALRAVLATIWCCDTQSYCYELIPNMININYFQQQANIPTGSIL